VNAKEFERLLAQCGVALERYVEEANRTCKLLSKCGPEALTLEQRSAIQAQRSAENAAHERYQNIRSRLLDAAIIGYETSQ